MFDPVPAPEPIVRPEPRAPEISAVTDLTPIELTVGYHKLMSRLQTETQSCRTSARKA